MREKDKVPKDLSINTMHNALFIANSTYLVIIFIDYDRNEMHKIYKDLIALLIVLEILAPTLLLKMRTNLNHLYKRPTFLL